MSVSCILTLRPLAGAMMAAALVIGTATAQEQAPPSDTVLARVNGQDITTQDVDQIGRDLADQLARVPPQQHLSVLINILIDIRLMARAAEAEGIIDDEIVKRRLANMRDNQLRAEYLRVKAFEPVTNEVVEERFQQELADFEPADEVRARHILVETEEKAIDIIAQLDDGADFAGLAREESQDPGSGANGGDLGFFVRGAMVKPFEDAAFGLESGSYTAEPVQSQFGWHVIKVEEIRRRPAPTLASRADEIRQSLVRQALADVSEALRANADIEIIDPNGAPAPAQ